MPITHPIEDALSQNLARAIARDYWEPILYPMLGGEALMTSVVGQPLVLQCAPETVALRFLRHPWSGAVAVTVGGGERRLFSLAADDASDELEVELSPQDHSFQVAVEALPVEGRAADRHQVWLLGLVFGSAPFALGRSVRLNAGTKLIYGDWGEFLALAGDDVLPDAIARDGSWAPEDIAMFRKHVRPGDVVLDIGANIGHHSVVFSKLVGDEGLVIAIEAQRVLYQVVHANALLNRRGNIVPIHAAAGEAEGSVTMHPINYTDNTNFGALGVNAAGIEYPILGEAVPCYRLDALLPSYLKGRSVAFAKIDVQAYELFVLRGMEAILASDRPTIFIEISPYWMRKAGYEFSEIYSLLRRHGYRLAHREGLELGPEGYPEIPDGSQFEWDLLAIHPERPE